jgi:isopentenyl phosphate kinase
MSLVFLKLGGSLITDKDSTDTPNLPVLTEISREISAAVKDDPHLHLVLGHGSGSFGHHAAHRFQTRQGVHSPEEWDGFTHVWERARALNQIMVENLVSAGIPVISFAPSSFLVTRNHEIQNWDTTAIRATLDHRIVPLLYGDVVLDREIGGTIVSTEELFAALAKTILPDRILLAGIEPGVWRDYQKRDGLFEQITPGFDAPENYKSMQSSSIDVTGGMLSKVQGMLQLIRHHPDVKVSIFTGLKSGNIYSSLMGESIGTSIEASERDMQ